MAFKVESTRATVLYVRCPKCHHNSGFSVAGIQQPSPGVVRILLFCTHNYQTIRRHREQCGHILAFDGVIS